MEQAISQNMASAQKKNVSIFVELCLSICTSQFYALAVKFLITGAKQK